MLGWCGFVCFFALCGVGAYWTMLVNANGRIDSFRSALRSLESAPDVAKLDLLGATILSGAEARFALALIFFVIIGTIASIGFGIFISQTTDIRTRSFLLLTKEAVREKEKIREKERNSYYSLVGGAVFGIVSGVFSNWLFMMMFS